MIVDGAPGLISDICKALGFEDVLSLQLDIPEEDVVTVTVKRIASVGEIEALTKVCRRYSIEATPIEPTEEHS
jgi:hypothetical protein